VTEAKKQYAVSALKQRSKRSKMKQNAVSAQAAVVQNTPFSNLVKDAIPMCRMVLSSVHI